MFISIRYVHTDSSTLDGLGTVEKYVARAKDLGMPALAITDHGSLAGTHEFYSECRKNEIEPILGLEGYFVQNAEAVKEDKNAERFHTTIIAKNEAGFKTLVELSSASHRQYYYKPLIDRPLIEGLTKKERENLVVLSGCAGSIISRSLMGGIDEDADEQLNWWKKMFPNFYIELMHHNCDFDRKLNRRLLKAAQRHDLEWVVTNDPHYVMKEEACHHDALLAIQVNKQIDDPNRFKFQGEGYHLKSHKEMKKAFKQYGDEVWLPGSRNTVEIAKSCKMRIKSWDSRTWHIPKFPKADDAQQELKRRAWRGLRERGLKGDLVYESRLKHELKEFKKVGMADFLLITADAADAAREKGIRLGPGRGSVCGTLVGWLIGIHKIDPIRYNLLFERFLNPERPKMPDIDTDFPPTRRKEMFDYIDDLYGSNNTMRVGAYQRMKGKKTFKSLATAYGIPFKEANDISKQIIEDEDGDAVLPEKVAEAYPELYETLNALLGIKTVVAKHAAGIIIFDPDDPIRHFVPEMRISVDEDKKQTKEIDFVSSFDLRAAGDLGLLKQDFLGLRTLDTIQECVDLIKARHGVDIEPDDWIPTEEERDEYVWKMLADGKVSGVFQMEGAANLKGIQEIECSEFESIVSCTSLYRAGPMIAGAPKRFNKNRKDDKVRVAHKTLKPFLKDSWGEMIYQEQMFQILNELAGFSWSRVDDAKTAMTRKDPVKMAQLKDEAVAGFQNVAGMDEEVANKVWDQMQAQAAYLFNRSHAVAYSMLSYQTARLKLLYPLEYFAALLRTVSGSSDAVKAKRESYLSDALAMNFKIMPPDVNVSDDRFMPNGKDELLFGLTDIKGVGESAMKKILFFQQEKGRPFKSVEEVAECVNNKGVVTALAAAGALRSLGVEPEIEKQEELLSWQFTDKVKPFRQKYAKQIKMPSKKDGYVCFVGEITKVDTLKTKTNKSYQKWAVRCKPGVELKVSVWDSADELFGLQKGSIVMVSGKWSAEWSNVGVSDPEKVKVIKKVTNKQEKKAS